LESLGHCIERASQFAYIAGSARSNPDSVVAGSQTFCRYHDQRAAPARADYKRGNRGAGSKYQ
jgi:hypothetical protein